MSVVDVFEKKRQIIPRWYTYDIAKLLGTLQTAEKKLISVSDTNQHIEKEENWIKNKKIPFAADLVGSAIILNDYTNTNAIDAANFILKSKNEASKLALELSTNFLSAQTPHVDEEFLQFTSDVRHYYVLISKLKKDLNTYPRNPIKWTDLAFFYAIIGQEKHAEQCIKIAISLCPNNRFILRSAARFFLHIKQSDKALFYLRRADNAKYDPWIIASEISISEASEERSKFIKEGRSIVKSSNMPAFHLSELLGTLGTLEINSGSLKTGKKLLKSALMDPTENTVAQVAWLSPSIHFDVTSFQKKLIDSFEAGAHINFFNGKYQEALNKTWAWLHFQPFSSNPSVFGSYIASVVLCDYEDAIKFCEHGKVSSPKDIILNNNHAFSLASIGRISEALKIFNGIDREALSKEENAILTATQGLIEFRLGKFDNARSLYRAAIETFKVSRDERAFWLATLFWLREEKRIKSQNSEELIKEARNQVNRTTLNELKYLADSL